MSSIDKKLLGFIFNASALNLATAPFKNNLNIVYGFNAGGTGYTSFKPSSNFNSLTQLVQDGVYIVDAATPGFELPGAMQTLAGLGSSAASPLTVDNFSAVGRTYQNGQKVIEIDFGVASTDPADFAVVMAVWNETTGFLQGVADMGGVNSSATTGISVGSLGSTLTDTYRVHVLSNQGHLFSTTFVPGS
ncbi:hypothetical protein E4631_15675 [Hymenobacter sp. UV11]|uniref:hypothetical protein n=1 Tax=Hymenobacter sp. UV11 TaxID=1849735 RepID=UPI00105C7974|nr:hypothetical protein [Hymenobacter sp. UV11]TDN39263.1 hypothetical protein A8B98_18565 [Hymenobacter sp. UV11]TFZ65657.1 hypothetical protein E4631_15675 [Hymenobacter sp. UV11]